MTFQVNPFAERRAKRHAQRLKDVAREVTWLRDSGMTAHEIVAALRAKRRLMGHAHTPGDAPAMIGLVPVLGQPGPLLEEGDFQNEPPECLVLEVYDDIDDD